jgi:NAD(P)-dependent dehydrogenase (short-subunit alcohol dehydrogenase family)
MTPSSVSPLTLRPGGPYLRRVKGKIAIVTGATSGIGRVTARELARTGAEVVLVARDATRGEETVAEIRRTTGNPLVSVVIGDVASQASVRRVAAEFLAKHDRLHLLVNNAGAIVGERILTDDGLEKTFATNHLAYFLLTNLLLDALKASGAARVVSVASNLHRTAQLDFDDLQYERRRYVPMQAYSQSKLANMVWSAELARRLAGTKVTSNALHPGIIASNISSTGPGWMRFGMKLVAPFLLSPDKGAETTLHVATSPDLEGVTGKYFEKKKPCEPGAAALDASAGPRLWAISEELTNRTAAAA